MTTKPETKAQQKAREIVERAAAKVASLERMRAEIDAIIRAEQNAREYIDQLTAILADGNFDINAVAPYPSSLKTSRSAYITAHRRREYTITHKGQIMLKRDAWNSSRYAILGLVRDQLSPGEVAEFVSHNFKRNEDNTAFVNGSETWRTSNGRELVFTIEQTK